MKTIACAAFAFLLCGTAYAQHTSADAAASVGRSAQSFG